MVVGYLNQFELIDLHAWFEAFIGGHWFLFDGAQKSRCGNCVIVGNGRDAADVALTSRAQRDEGHRRNCLESNT